MTETWLDDLETMLDAELVAGALESPFRPTLMRRTTAAGQTVDPAGYLSVLEGNQIGGRGGTRRYRWSFPVGRWVPLEDRIAWRPREAELAERQAADHAARLWTPIVLVDHVEWLERLTHHQDRDLAGRARRLLDEAAPTLEDDVARQVMGADAWADTFMLWTFARRPRAIGRVRGLMSAVAARYAARAARDGGLVLGRSFPFFEVPLPSATAHLASAAARLGDGIEVVGPAVDWLRRQRRPDGGWADPGQPTDLLTTIAVAELLSFLDPEFDPAGVLPSLAAAVDRRGGPMLIGPEWPWVATEILAFAAWGRRPFRERFRWPHVPGWMIDDRVAVPRYEAYLVNARLFETIPGLSGTPVEIAFVDLANFGHWNTANGMVAGDNLLARLTAQLRTVPESRTIRDGGDEFLVVGAPEATGLEERLRGLFAAWPAWSREAWPDLPVVPLRAAITTTRADRLRSTREALGKWIGKVKADYPDPPEHGVLVSFEPPGG